MRKSSEQSSGFYLESSSKTVYDVTTTLLELNKINLICFIPWIFSKKTKAFLFSVNDNEQLKMSWSFLQFFSLPGAGCGQLSHQQPGPRAGTIISSGSVWQLSWPRLHGEFNAVCEKKDPHSEPWGYDSIEWYLKNRSCHSWIIHDW